ncbi:MAG: APC family permease [Planctomycetota bacterium]
MRVSLNERDSSEAMSDADVRRLTTQQFAGPPLSQTSLTLLVVASMIGAGAYTTSGFAVADLGSPAWVMVAWVLAGFVAFCGAVGYGLLTQRLCDNGGEYLYLSRFIHPVAGFIAGWVSLLAGFTGAGAFAAIAFASYANPKTSNDAADSILAMGLIATATLMHCQPRRRGVLGQNTIVIVKLVILSGFIATCYAMLGRWNIDSPAASGLSPTSLTSRWPGWLPLATTIMWTSLSYSGFNASIYVAGDARDGSKGVARAMIIATVAVIGIYCLLNAAFVYGPSADSIRGQRDVAAIAAKSIGGSPLELLVRIAICFGLASSVSSVLMIGPRVYAKMAQDGVFPKWFDSPQAPRRMILAQGLAMMVVAGIADLRGLLSYLSLTLALSAALTVATLFRSVHRSTSNWSIAHGLAAIYVVSTLILAGLTARHQPMQAYAALLTLTSGWLAYVAMHWLRRRKEIAG